MYSVLQLYAYVQGPMNVTQYGQQLLTASIVFFALNDILLLIGLVYALALFIRLVVEGCRKQKDKHEPTRDQRWVYGKLS